MSATVSRWISVIGGSTLLITGTIGSLFNIAIFSDRSLRKCSCSWYILIAAFFDLITLDHPLLLRIISDGFGLDLVSMNVIYCKLRFYTGQIGSFVPITLICLAAIDRWASTCRSVRIRQWSSIRIARYSIIITILAWSVLSVPNLLVYQIINGVCKQTSSTYNGYAAFFLNPVLYDLLPVSVLASFGYCSYTNVRQITNRQHRNQGRVEDQLTKSLILQCISFTLSQVPYTLWNLYLTFTVNEIKSPSRMSIETLFTQLTRLLFYFNYVSTFYINLIASKHIRNLAKCYLLLLISRKMASSNDVHGSNAPIKRQPTMGLLDAINLLLACIIGSGIFISAKAVLEYSGSYGLSIVVWIGCGLLCIMGALCYAELGCAYVSSGGDYTYLRVAFGNFPGFLRVWIEVVLSRPMIVVLSVLTASNYLVYWFYPTCPPPNALVKCLSSFLLFIVGFINLTSALWTNRLHQVCNYFKIASLLIVVGAGLYRMILGRVENFAEPFEGSTYAKLPSALYAGLFPYAGWNYLNNAIDDLKDPKRILPRSIIISLLICIFIYFLTFSSYFTALSAYDILISDATAVSFAERVYPPLLYIIPIGVTMSCVGAASGNIFTVGQMFNVAGRDGLMPHIFSMKHYKSNVPMIAIMCEIIVSFVFLFFMSNIGKLIICVGMINWICILMAAVGLIVLRYKDPDRERPIKIPLPIPIIFITILVILIVASALTDIDNITTSLTLLATAIPAYVFGVMWKKKPSSFNRRYNSFAITLQKLFHVVHDEHGD